MEKAYFEDCRVGDKVVTPGRTITEADLVLFAAHAGDWLPPHTDAEFAKTTPFGERIAHGLLTLAVGSALLLRLGEFTFLPRSSIAVAEVDKVHFRSPTKIGDTLYLEAEIQRMLAIDRNRGLLVLHCAIKNQRGETAVSFTAKVLVGRGPTREIEPSGRVSEG